MLKRTLLCLLLTIPFNNHAAIIYYSFVGEVSSFYEANGGLGLDRSVKVGDVINAIYTLESDTSVESGSTGSVFAISVFTKAITNFALYINDEQFINDDYRIQRMAVINGKRNSRAADWLEIDLTGRRDNYLNDYGINEHGEYITSRLEMVDHTARVFDPFKTSYGMPLAPDIDDFTSTFIQADARDINSNLQWSLRASFTDIRSDNQVTSVSEPVLPLSAIIFCVLCALNNKRRRAIEG